MTTTAKSELWVRIGSAIILFAIAGTALWFGGIAFGLLPLVRGALVLVERHQPVKALALRGGAKTAPHILGPLLVLVAMLRLGVVLHYPGMTPAVWVLVMTWSPTI